MKPRPATPPGVAHLGPPIPAAPPGPALPNKALAGVALPGEEHPEPLSPATPPGLALPGKALAGNALAGVTLPGEEHPEPLGPATPSEMALPGKALTGVALPGVDYSEPLSPAALPQPPGLPGLGHLWHWSRAPLPLLAAGARAGPVFRLRLWRPVLVGYRPEWNRTVLTDLDTFRSRGSLSGLTPYLSDGIVYTDVPEHRTRRRRLNGYFSAHALAGLDDGLREISDRHRPEGGFEALDWAGPLVRHMLNAALFGGALPAWLLARFLRPLHRRLPAPMLPRPHVFRRVDHAIARVLRNPPAGAIAAALAGHPDAVTDLRVALAAGYDTTSHTLAWAAWHLGAHPSWRHPQQLPMFVDEMLRLYPAGWVGSRVTSRDSEAAGIAIPAGTLVLYSPYLTHHDPGLWPDPHLIRPERFESGHPGWSYLPFASGPRTCLGARLARLMIRAALSSLCDGHLAQAGADPGLATGITLLPRGPLRLHFSPRGR